MKNRRAFVLALTSGLVALALVAPVIADELFGTIKSVNADAMKMVVTPKDSDKDVTVTITEDTEIVTKKATIKGGEAIKKYMAKDRKGTVVEITHEKAVASKIVIKKGAAPKKDN